MIDYITLLCAWSVTYLINPSSLLNLGRIILTEVESSKINTVPAAIIIRLLTGVGPAEMQQFIAT